MNKNKKRLKEFTEYCNKHPEQRFFQALRNWLKVDRVLCEKTRKEDYGHKEVEDTFYWD